MILRPETEADLPWLWHWRHEVPDAEWKRWDAPYFHTADAPVPWPEFRAAAAPPSRDVAVIEVDGSPVGTVIRWEEDPAGGGWWEVGVVIFDPAHWGGGTGTAACREWVRRTFAETDAHVVTMTTWSGNERMIRTARRLGLVECARIPQARLWQGRRYDSVKLAILREGTAG